MKKILITLSILCLFGAVDSMAQIRVKDKAKAARAEVRAERRAERKSRRMSMEGEIQLSGAFALYPLVVRWSEEFRKQYPKIKIDVSAGGAGKGITDAVSGVVDMGMVSREINPIEIQKGAFVIKVAKDAVVATVNARNPYSRELLTRGLTREMAAKLWSGKASTWGEVLGTESKVPVHVYTRSDACGAAETWGSWFGLKQEQIEGLAVFGDPGVASVVQKDKLAIGFNNIAYAYDLKTRKPHRGIMVMPIDVNGNRRVDLSESFYGRLDQLNGAIADGRYPMPPARDLYLVCKGKPTKPEVLAFLDYILTEGQFIAPEVGFIPLSEDVLDEELDKLN